MHYLDIQGLFKALFNKDLSRRAAKFKGLIFNAVWTLYTYSCKCTFGVYCVLFVSSFIRTGAFVLVSAVLEEADTITVSTVQHIEIKLSKYW